MNWNEADSHEVLAHVAQAANSSSPFGDFLRAAAEEHSDGRVGESLRKLAERVDRGTPLADAIREARELPVPLAEIVAAASRTGRLGPTLNEWIDQQWRMRELRQSTWNAVSYPLVVALLSVTLALWLPYYLAPQFLDMYKDFRLVLPKSFFWTTEVWRWGPWVFLGLLFSVLMAFVTRAVINRATWRGVVSHLPIVGSLSVWSGLSEFFRLLAMLIENEVPLLESLQFAADGVQHPHVSRAVQCLKTNVENGSRLSDAIHQTRCVPLAILPVLDWSERSQSLPQGLRTAADFFEERVSRRTAWVAEILPPIVLAFGVGSIAGTVALFLLPLAQLISNLS